MTRRITTDAPLITLINVNTGSFDFLATGATEVEAFDSLRKAWRKHCREYRVVGVSMTWDEVREWANVVTIPLGGTLRDGESI